MSRLAQQTWSLQTARAVSRATLRTRLDPLEEPLDQLSRPEAHSNSHLVPDLGWLSFYQELVTTAFTLRQRSQ